MKFSELATAFKDIFFDILGYLLPGLFILGTIFISLSNEYNDNIHKYINTNTTMVLMMFAYIISYVIFGFSEIKLSALSYYTKKENTVYNNIKSDEVYWQVLEILKEQTKLSLQDPKVRNIRNLCMSFVPSSDKKIYEFMFRGELCNNIATAIILFDIIFLVNLLLSIWNLNVIELATNYIIFYVALNFLIFPLEKARFRFWSISMRIVFPIFLANHYKDSSTTNSN
ncbi:MAG: hypothetical protein JEZ14_11305 [Marinilabiliaceae bacterium]|nr:hypothetical protein [Marinilabiliaceae bacterium]